MRVNPKRAITGFATLVAALIAIGSDAHGTPAEPSTVEYLDAAFTLGGTGSAQEFLPELSVDGDLSSATTFEVRIKEQAKIEVPALVVFDVTDITQDTSQNGTSRVRATGVALAPGKSLLIQVAAAAASFTDEAGNPSYSASNVSWAHGAVSGGTGADGALAGAGQFVDLMTCSAGSCWSDALVFTLGATASQTVAGTHTLTGFYRVSSIL